MGRNQSGGSNFDIGNYVEVKDRVAQFWIDHPEGRIVTNEPSPVEIDGRWFIASHAEVYKHRDNTEPDGTGSAWEQFPGKTPFTRDSEAMNAETSAIGRALGFINIGIAGSLASADEVRNRNEERNAPAPDPIPDGALRKDAAKKRVASVVKAKFPNAAPDYIKATAAGIWTEAESDKKVTDINGAPYLLEPEVKVLDEITADTITELLKAPTEGAA